MTVDEKAFAALQKQARATGLEVILVSIDLYLYKAQIAQRRWGSPGGNDAALGYYETVEELVARASWPEALAQQVEDFNTHLARFRGYLKAQDVTRVSFEATRLEQAFQALGAGLHAWASAAE